MAVLTDKSKTFSKKDLLNSFSRSSIYINVVSIFINTNVSKPRAFTLP